MVNIIARLLILSLATSLLPVAASSGEGFEGFFSRLHHDRAFLQERTAGGFTVREEIVWPDSGRSLERTIPCGLVEMENNGWVLFPRTPKTARYSAAKFMAEDEVTVSLGVPDSSADAEYFFKRRAGKWYLTGALVVTALPEGRPVSPPPCHQPQGV